jgi:MFS transporter, DHA1 family, multidrug resistance protein
MDKKTLPIAAALGALCALGPFATDMHVAAMPRMAGDLATSDATIQLSMMTYFGGFTIGQLFYGPASDKTGRKPMIYLALAIFVAASLGCIFTESATQLLVYRFLQGIGGSIGMVIATAAIRDLYTGHRAAKLMSMVVMVLGIGPVVAPLLGSFILQTGSWRTIFAVLAVVGVLAGLIVFTLLPETRMAELRAQSRPSAALHWYGRLLISHNFIPYAATLAFAQGGFFAYIGGSSFVLMNVYGLSPTVFAVVFAGNSIGIGLGTQIGARLAERIGSRPMIKAATAIYALAAVLLLAMELTGTGNLYSVCLLLFVWVMALGGIMPSCNILTMEAHGAISGTAAALMGALGFGAGALGSFGAGIFANGTALPLFSVIAIFAIAAMLVAFLTFGRQKVPHPEHA